MRLAPRRPPRALAAALVAALAVSVPSRPSRADEAAARAHFKKGVELYDAKRYEEALAAFRDAYREKPSPGILQNIALSLRGLGRNADAANAFSRALAAPEGELKPETRAAMQRELAELEGQVAALEVRVLDEGQRPLAAFVTTVDGREVVGAAPGARVYLEPGLHVIGVRVPGGAAPPDKKLSFVPGAPVDVTFSVSRSTGRLVVRAKVEGATVKIDGVDVGRDAWQGEVPAGVHRVEVSAPRRQTATFDVEVPPGGNVELPVALLADAPDGYEKPERKVPPDKRRYAVPMLSFVGGTLRQSAALGESGSSRRGFTGASLGIRGGYRFAKLFAFEGLFEVSSMTSKYAGAQNPLVESESRVTEVVLAPMVRFSTPGSARFVAAIGFGAQMGFAKAKVPLPVQQPTAGGPTTEPTGRGISGTAQADLGLQVDVGPVFLEGLLFGDLYGVGAIEDNQDRRLFLASPGVRYGLRLGVGIPF